MSKRRDTAFVNLIFVIFLLLPASWAKGASPAFDYTKRPHEIVTVEEHFRIAPPLDPDQKRFAPTGVRIKYDTDLHKFKRIHLSAVRDLTDGTQQYLYLVVKPLLISDFQHNPRDAEYHAEINIATEDQGSIDLFIGSPDKEMSGSLQIGSEDRSIILKTLKLSIQGSAAFEIVDQVDNKITDPGIFEKIKTGFEANGANTSDPADDIRLVVMEQTLKTYRNGVETGFLTINPLKSFRIMKE